jgi:hypothetical protein
LPPVNLIGQQIIHALDCLDRFHASILNRGSGPATGDNRMGDIPAGSGHRGD